MTERISGFTTSHERSSSFVTDKKSLPKKTRVTPPIWKSYAASGDMVVYLICEKSIVVPSPVTGFPGVNFSEEGLGVGADCINRCRIII